MKQICSIFIVVMLLVVSCTNKKHPSEYYPKSVPSYESYTEPARQDSVKHETTDQQPSSSASSASSSGNSKYKDKELDNMRGFDPASENDMDDNGMQRYFDANDDEAWD